MSLRAIAKQSIYTNVIARVKPEAISMNIIIDCHGSLHFAVATKRKENTMNKKEKIIATLFILSFILLITSSIYTIIQTKPDGYSFRIEKLFR